jgi:hypothetical protein
VPTGSDPDRAQHRQAHPPQIFRFECHNQSGLQAEVKETVVYENKRNTIMAAPRSQIQPRDLPDHGCANTVSPQLTQGPGAELFAG